MDIARGTDRRRTRDRAARGVRPTRARHDASDDPGRERARSAPGVGRREHGCPVLLRVRYPIRADAVAPGPASPLAARRGIYFVPNATAGVVATVVNRR